MIVFTRKKFIYVGIILSIVISLGFAVYLYLFHNTTNLSVNFLDVGQGSAIFIQTPYHQNILIDGGDVDAKVLRQLPKFMPFYDRSIDLIIVTHPHDDHVGGLVKVLQRYKVYKIIYNGLSYNSPTYEEFLQTVQDHNIPLVIADKQQIIHLGSDLQLEILYPFTSLVGKQIDNWNNTSIVSRLVYKNNKFLFTGDIENAVEEKLISQDINIQADVMLAAHHGSDTSNTLEFLQTVQPSFSVIQCGLDNEFGHPSLRVLRRLDRLGVTYLRNDWSGWVRFVSDGYNISYETEK